MPNKNSNIQKARYCFAVAFLSLGVAVLIFTFTAIASIDYGKVGPGSYPYSFILSFSYDDAINDSSVIAQLGNVSGVESISLVRAFEDDIPDEYQNFYLTITSQYQDDNNILLCIQNIIDGHISNASIWGQAFEREIIRSSAAVLFKIGIISSAILLIVGFAGFLNYALRSGISFKSGIFSGGIAYCSGLLLGILVVFFITSSGQWAGGVLAFTIPYLSIAIVGALVFCLTLGIVGLIRLFARPAHI